MRDTVDFGIDLGTTNSALAVVADGDISVVKNNRQMDYTPSVVWMPAPGQIWVGQKARERMDTDPDDVHSEFKQEMGLNDARRTFARAGVTLTPPQLSAEVLKSLRADAAQRLGESPEAAVITVPAAFRLHETDATSEAAKLAGFTSTCMLIQEPTAAAYAFGFQSQSSDGYCMVFDFGGGTFDSAVINTQDGEFRVLDHAGDRHLGGKLIDWAIVNRLLAPAVVKEYGFADFTPDNPVWKKSFAKLKVAAEEAKIELSTMDRVELLVDLAKGTDDVGLLSYTLTRDELERLAEPYYARAINLCREALTKANLHTGDIDRLLLVGGPTLAPGLREMLADPREGLGIALDFSQDPSTAVARGAAVFAGTLPLEHAFVAPSVGEISVELDYPRTTSLTSVAVSGRFHSGDPVDWSGYRVTLDNPTAKIPFRTPMVSLQDNGTFTVEVRLDELAGNTFTIELVDATGSRKKVSPDTILIQHWRNEPSGPVLTNSLGVAQADGTYSLMLKKGATLPASATRMFQTTAALHRNDSDGVVRIPIMEGERPRANRNLKVAVTEIRSHDVRIDLPKGSDVEVTINVDASRLVTAVADVPMLAEQFDAIADLNTVATPDADTLRYQLSEAETRLSRLRVSVQRSGSKRAAELLAVLDREDTLPTARDEVARAAAGDNGAAAAAEQRLRDLMAELDEIEDEVAVPSQLDELAALLGECREMAGRIGNASDRAELARLERQLDIVRRTRESAAILDLKDQAADLYVSLLQRDGHAFDVAKFYALRSMAARMTSPSRSAQLVAEGENAIAAQRWDLLRGVNERLRRLLPDDVEVDVDGYSEVRETGGQS
jgi:molecular chaperone DnaK